MAAPPDDPHDGSGETDGLDTSDVVQALPGLARIAAGAWWRTASWSAGAGVRASGRVLRAARSGESVGELVSDARRGLRSGARELLGVGSEAPSGTQEVVVRHDMTPVEDGDDPRPVPLRERGAELLRRSADVHLDERAHPAYERILVELAPDEARILRFLAAEGAQPAVDVRAGRTPLTQSQMVAPGLSMIGAQAGVRFGERLPAYLNNLFRLGLIWFSREPLEDPLRYQVLEAQPDVLAAKRKQGRAKTVRRSIHLTPFGEDFCAVCLPVAGVQRNQ